MHKTEAAQSKQPGRLVVTLRAEDHKLCREAMRKVGVDNATAVANMVLRSFLPKIIKGELININGSLKPVETIAA